MTLRRGVSTLCVALSAIMLLSTACTQNTGQTYYIAPEGADSASGLTETAAWKTFDHALPRLAPGDTLVLLDGKYLPAHSGRFFADGFQDANNGTKERPITVKAKNERKAWIVSDGLDAAILLQNLKWWNVEGLRASNSDNPAAKKGGEGVKLINAEHVTLRRILAHHNNRYRNSQMIIAVLSENILVEESEIYYYHRNGFEAYRSSNVTFRRCYANSRGHADLPDGRGSHTISEDGGDWSYISYHGSNITVENSISEYKNEGFNTVTGLPTNVVYPDSMAADHPDELDGYPTEYYDRIAEENPEPSGANNKFLGVISISDNRSMASTSRVMAPSSRPLRNTVYRDVLIVGGRRGTFFSRAVKDITLENFTVLGSSTPVFTAGTGSAMGGYWPSCEAIDGCRFRLRNWLVFQNPGPVLGGLPEFPEEHLDFLMEYSNLHNNPPGIAESISDDSGWIRQSQSERPSGVGLEQGDCLVYIPESSNMSGAGADGADIGANILYRYVDGDLTDEPLWNPETGAFPHGAVIEGVNSFKGRSAFDVHQRLNVNNDGCMLPYSQ